MILTSFIETASDHNSQQDFFGFPENHCNEVTTNGPNKKLHALQSKCSDRSKVFNPIKAISSILLLCTLLLVNPANASDNIALNKPTSQSSIGWGGLASRAVDGNTSGDYWRNSVTHTNFQTNPWWNVNLQSPYDINKIKIYNRADCCTSRLGGFKVTVFDGAKEAWTWKHGGGTPGAVTTLTLPPSTIGDKVEVMIPGSNKILSLAEVEVFGMEVKNIALYKPTSQSSNHYSGGLGFSDKAVDGTKDGLMKSGDRSVTHTRSESNPWWNVDLQSQYSISEIMIYDRTDCTGCEGRLSRFKVTVFDGAREAWTWTHGGGIPSAVTTLTLPPRIVGDKVEVRIPGSNKILSLAEVEVFGRPVENALVNVALKKPTDQISTRNGGLSSRAVDGNTKNGYLSNGSVTMTDWEINPWWTVDLKSVYNIKEIKIYNCLNDVCFQRLKSLRVEVYNGAKRVWRYGAWIGPSFAMKTLTLPPSINGDKVKVINDGYYHDGQFQILSLAEVEVFGYLV